MFPDAADDVSITLPPVQNEVAPLAEIVGAAGEDSIAIETG